MAWPQPVRKGRPKFLLTSAAQANTGPHKLSNVPGDTAQVPAPINKFLRPYQREGAEFLYGQFKKGIGGILGDDMVRPFGTLFVVSHADAPSLGRASARRSRLLPSSPPS